MFDGDYDWGEGAFYSDEENKANNNPEWDDTNTPADDFQWDIENWED